VEIKVTTADVTNEIGCEEIISLASSLGPVNAIFNLAVALRDGIFDNLDEAQFNESLAPKALATRNLDKLSRKLCPNLKHFVVFSSIACGRGNAGQTNYGMANSIMERIVEERVEDNLPGKAIQWGAIADVGLLANLNNYKQEEKSIGGTFAQPIRSCIEVLDDLLTSNDAIVSSMVIADKNNTVDQKEDLISMILNIMGIQDRKNVSMNSTLVQLGLDSLMGVEIHQFIERNYDMNITSQELRKMKLYEFEKRVNNKNDSKLDIFQQCFELNLLNYKNIIASRNKILKERIIKANDCEDRGGLKVLIIPGMYAILLEESLRLVSHLKCPAYFLNTFDMYEYTNFDDLIELYKPAILEIFSNTEKFLLIGHSFGLCIALKFAKILEENNKCGEILSVDGSPQLSVFCAQKTKEMLNFEIFRAKYSSMIMEEFPNLTDRGKIENLFERIALFEDIHCELNDLIKELEEQDKFVLIWFLKTTLNGMKIAIRITDENFDKLSNVKITLIKASKMIYPGLDKSYGLNNICNSEINFLALDIDHVTIINHKDLPDIVKKMVESMIKNE
jgi:fatty acid synthase